ncbi:hypothetical protein ACFPM3_14295 [Streptomyces coeruleoprunus]|uniref:Uncharacterized protein n=1 Tax=Streptomyces coeruleoprunus TaxID=285563 RepID=A0ABV9XED8_9ACTN
MEVFTKGIDRLPDRPCAGAVERDTVARALPSARKAVEKEVLSPDQFDWIMFTCSVTTSDGHMILGDVQPTMGSLDEWRDYFSGGKLEENAVEVSSGDVLIRTSSGYAAAYVPCTLSREAESQRGEHKPIQGLVVVADTLGRTRAKGTELAQVMGDFAYQLAVHVYKIGGCQQPRTFPDALPPVASGEPVIEP